MKGMFLKKFDIYYQKCATVAQRFPLSMTKLGACDEIRWNDGTCYHRVPTYCIYHQTSTRIFCVFGHNFDTVN